MTPYGDCSGCGEAPHPGSCDPLGTAYEKYRDEKLADESFKEFYEQATEEIKDIDWRRSYGFHAAIAANLLAGDIQARVVENGYTCFVEVKLVGGTSVLWAMDFKDLPWRWTHTTLLADGELVMAHTETPWDTEVDEVAKMIALHEYGGPIEFPLEHPGDL